MTLDLSFHATCNESYITGINKYLGISKDFDIEVGNPSFTVNYNLEPESRQWGIKYISITVEKVLAEIEWEIYSGDFTEEQKKLLVDAGGTEYRNETIAGTIVIDSTGKLEGKEWKVTSSLEFEKDGGLRVELVEILFDTMEIIISSNN